MPVSEYPLSQPHRTVSFQPWEEHPSEHARGLDPYHTKVTLSSGEPLPYEPWINREPMHETYVPRVYEGNASPSLSASGTRLPSGKMLYPEAVTQGRYHYTKPSFRHRFMRRTGLGKLGEKMRIYHPHHKEHHYTYDAASTLKNDPTSFSRMPRYVDDYGL